MIGILWILGVIVCLGTLPYIIFLRCSLKIPDLNPGLTMFVSGFYFIITAGLLYICWALQRVYLIVIVLIAANIFFGFMSTKKELLYRIRDSLGGLGVPVGWFWFHKWEAIDTPMESQRPILHAFLSCFLGNLWLMLGWFGILIITEKAVTFSLFIIASFLLLILSLLGAIGGYMGKSRAI